MATLTAPEIPPCPADYGRHQWLMEGGWGCRRAGMTATTAGQDGSSVG